MDRLRILFMRDGRSAKTEPPPPDAEDELLEELGGRTAKVLLIRTLTPLPIDPEDELPPPDAEDELPVGCSAAFCVRVFNRCKLLITSSNFLINIFSC